MLLALSEGIFLSTAPFYIMMALGSRIMQELLRENLLATNAEFAAFANFHLHLQEDLKEADKIEE